MKKRPILNAYETKIFNEWIADGNAVEQKKGVWVEQSTQYRKKFTYEELQKFFKKEYLSYRTGGKIGFDALAKKVAKRYAGEKVEPQYQAEYGKKYSKSEAEEVGRKVAGKVYWQKQGRKFNGGGVVEEIKKKYQIAGSDSNGVYTYSKWVADEIASKYGGDVQQVGSNWYVRLEEKFNGGGGVDTVKKDRYGNEVRIGDAIRIKVLTGRYGQTNIYEGVVTNFGLFGKVELDGQRELTYTANYIHNDYEHGHHIWVEKINENDINENLRVPKKFVPSYSGTINGEKFAIQGRDKFQEWLDKNYPNSVFKDWFTLYNKGWRNKNGEYLSPEKVPYTEVRVYESAETGQGFLYSLMIPKTTPQSTTKTTDKKTALGNKLRKGMVVRIEYKENNGSTLSNDLFFDDGKFIKYILITDKKGKELSETEETISEIELNEYYKEYKEYIIDEFYEQMADGGSVPNLNKMFHLPIEMAVYVPSTQDVNNVISVDEMDKRVREVKEYLANKFGGYTSAEKIGGFVDSQAELVNEEVVQITAFSTKEAYEENKEALVQKLSDWAKEWGQEAIGFEYEGDLMYVPQKFVGGGKVLASSSSKQGINKLIEQYLYGSTITLVETDNDKIYEVHNKKGKTPFYVEFSRGKYKFIQPSKFVGGGKAIRQTHFAVYKLLDKQGLVKYFTDTDLEKFLEEWNEDYNTDYEDYVEFNEYEREFIIKPVFSKNDMGGMASEPSFLEIQINDVPNWENYELANYLDAPISLVAKNRNFYIQEVQNEMMLNNIPTYAGGGSAKKSTKYHPLNEYYEKYVNGGFVGGDIIKFKYDGKDFTRKVESVDEMGNAIVNIMKTQKATINPADVFEIKKEKDDKSIIIEKIGLNEENANFLIGLSPTFAVWLADSIVELTTKSNLYGSREETIKKLNESPYLVSNFRERIRGILDWLQHPTTRKQNLRELTFGEAERKAKEWHNELQTAGGDIDFVEPIENTVITEYPENDNGVKYYWVFIPKGYCDVESARMGHCGRTGAGSLISLRSIRPYTEGTTITDSHVTIAYNKEEGLFYQSKGKRNAKPSEKYFPYIFDLIKMMASGQLTKKYKLTQKEKIKELQSQYVKLEKEVNKLQKYFESREAIEEDTNVLVEKATIFQTEKKALESINSQIDKLNEESSFDFNGFGSEYQSSGDYGYEDMTNEQVKELYEIKPDMFNDFAGRYMLYQAGIIDEKPNTTIVIEKSPEYVADLLRLDSDLSDEVVEKVLTGETDDWFSGNDSWSYYFQNAGDYVDELKGENYDSVIDKIVEITGYDKEEVKENGAKYYLDGEDENFDSDSFDDIKRAIANPLESAEISGYLNYYYDKIKSALEELGTIEKLDYTGVVLSVDLSNLLNMNQINAYMKNLESESLEDVFFEAESQGEIELPNLSIDDRYQPYPDDWEEYFDINNYEEGGVIYQDLSKIKPMVVNDKTVLTEFELKKSKSGVEINDKISNSDDVVNILRKIWEEDTINANEQAYVLFLNKGNKVMGYYHHSNGGIDGTIMDIQMISGMAVKSLAKGVIIAHNHPSGSTNPSPADKEITKKLSEALKLFNIQLLDSMIITEKSYFSFANEGLL